LIDVLNEKNENIEIRLEAAKMYGYLQAATVKFGNTPAYSRTPKPLLA
jgi:hypothetical protein